MTHSGYAHCSVGMLRIKKLIEKRVRELSKAKVISKSMAKEKLQLLAWSPDPFTKRPGHRVEAKQKGHYQKGHLVWAFSSREASTVEF